MYAMDRRRIECDSSEGRLICDEVVAQTEMDAAIERVVEKLTGSGVVSASSNRRAFRVAQEPLDLFRSYFAVYALEQAYCRFSPALIANLEQNWNAKNRKLGRCFSCRPIRCLSSAGEARSSSGPPARP